MKLDDIIYISILLVSLYLAHLVKLADNAKRKKLLVSLPGVFLVMFTCGFDGFHSLVTSLINITIIKFISPRCAPYLSFVWCFGYLAFFRLSHFLGLSPPSAFSNAVQLLLTLKMVGLAFEVHDEWKITKIFQILDDQFKKEVNKKKDNQIKSIETDITEKNEKNQKSNKAISHLISKPSDEEKNIKLNIEKGVTDENPLIPVDNILGQRKSTLVKSNYILNASYIDMLVYSYSFIGIMTGPYYSYRTFYDMLNSKQSRRFKTSHILISKLKILPFVVGTFLVISYFYQLETLYTTDFYETSTLLERLFFMFAMFTWFRCRLYIAWLLSECICVASALGAYPYACKAKCGAGPSDSEELKKWREEPIEEEDLKNLDFKTIINISIYGCELSSTIKEGMRSWNMTVQYWLANNVYKRVPYKNKFSRVAVTMLVSAYWHGIHPGYYLSFLLIPLNQLAEDLFVSLVKTSRYLQTTNTSTINKEGVMGELKSVTLKLETVINKDEDSGCSMESKNYSEQSNKIEDPFLRSEKVALKISEIIITDKDDNREMIKNANAAKEIDVLEDRKTIKINDNRESAFTDQTSYNREATNQRSCDGSSKKEKQIDFLNRENVVENDSSVTEIIEDIKKECIPTKEIEDIKIGCMATKEIEDNKKEPDQINKEPITVPNYNEQTTKLRGIKIPREANFPCSVLPEQSFSEYSFLSQIGHQNLIIIFDWLTWFFKMRSFEYMSMGFMLLRMDRTLEFWSSVYYCGHWLIFFFIILGYLCKFVIWKKKRGFNIKRD